MKSKRTAILPSFQSGCGTGTESVKKRIEFFYFHNMFDRKLILVYYSFAAFIKFYNNVRFQKSQFGLFYRMMNSVI